MKPLFFFTGLVWASLSLSSSLQDHLNKAARDCRTSEVAVETLEKEIQAQEAAFVQKAETLKKQHQKMGRLLVLLRNLETEVPSHIVRHGKEGRSILHSMTAMGAYLRGLRRQIVHIKKELQEVEAQKRALENKKKTLFSEVTTYKEKHAKIADLLQKQKEKEAKEQAKTTKTEALAKESPNLKALIKKLEKSAQFPVKGSEASGLLLPVQGPRIATFGTAHNHSPDGKGVVFETRPNSYVLAPTTGEVLFAGPFRTYKNIVIIGFQKKHTVLMTGLGKVTTETGKYVSVGDPIGQMDAAKKGYLYLEMRQDGTTIKPEILGAE